MTLSFQEKQAVSISLFKNADLGIEYLLQHVGPPGEAVKTVVKLIQSSGIRDSIIECLAISYSLEADVDCPSRPWCTTGDCPVRGRFVAHSSIIPVDLVNDVNAALLLLSGLPAEINPLTLAEVFPARLAAVRLAWIKEAKLLFPAATDLDDDANTIDWRLALEDFIGGMPKPDCKGSSCPGKPALVVKT